MVLITVVFFEAFRRWYALMRIDKTIVDSYGDEVLALANEGSRTD